MTKRRAGFSASPGGSTAARVRSRSARWAFRLTGSADADVAFFRSFVHPIKAYRRWDRRRRLGAYALDDEDERRG